MSKSSAPRILIVKLSAIGDVIHTLPALNALRRRFPSAHITWLVEPAAAGLIEGHAALDRVLVADRREWVRGLTHGPRADTLGRIGRFVRELRNTRFDLVLDYQAHLKGSLWVALCRGRRRIGFGPGMEHQEMSWLFLNQRVPAVSMEMHALQRNLAMLAPLGIGSRRVVYRLPVTAADRAAADRLLAGVSKGGPGPLITVNPIAKWPSKLWDPARFARLSDRLIDDGRAAVVFTGAPEDRPAIDGIMARMHHRALSVAGQTSLRQLAALYERTACLVTTDTGPMHLAAAVGIPVVALFGPTAPWRTGPYGPGHVVVRAPRTCAPCFRRQCPAGRNCMGAITVDAVWQGVMKTGVIA